MSADFGQQHMKNFLINTYITDEGRVVQRFKVISHETNCIDLLIFQKCLEYLCHDALFYYVYPITYILQIFCTAFTESCPLT